MNSKVKERNDEIVDYYLQRSHEQKFDLDLIEEISKKFFLSEESIKTIITKNTEVITVRIRKNKKIKPLVIRPKMAPAYVQFSKGLIFVE